MISSAILNPADVIKCRLQTQKQLVARHVVEVLPYNGFSHAFTKILQEEGYFRGLMKGVTASMLREASYSSVRLGLYDPIKSIIAPKATSKDDFTLIQKILAGGLSGAIGSAFANPTDLVKIRFQNVWPGQPQPYRNTLHAFVAIFRDEGGLKGLYRGVSATIVRASVLTASQLSAYDHAKRYLLHHTSLGDHPSTHIIAALVSGLVAATATNPVDVIKTRVMSDASVLYSSPLDCLVKTAKNEGLRGFMRGWTANWARLGPHFVISMPLLEMFRRLLKVDTL
eukprot:TRINITY_DN9808_c0_g1_i3.p1 TRINITY_DN9808_c0_g1~~TRINITY_DN9808_c0_g1_i3.p1  ORF type:complete len:283 (+),score=64.12 TRINITY_DN9808_c0_g1_i3:105-953(+)